ncbi:Pre-mRNA-splicing factor CLF1, partial [Linum grandiflorum]
KEIKDVVLHLRRFQYEDEVKNNPVNYNSWYDFIRLEESAGDINRVNEVSEPVIANQPPSQEKRLYCRTWCCNFACQELFRLCLQQIRHAKFSSAKIWLLAAQFEVRQMNLKGVRQIFEDAVREAPKV